MPGAGPLIAAVENATGVSAVIVGKPSPTLITQLLAKHGLDPARTVMVGDRLDTDMAFGAAGGVARCLVLSGVATEAQAAQLPLTDPRRPTHMLNSLAELQW
jgi:ribonucleotide monophosphatase NagD (HAD superfamily)